MFTKVSEIDALGPLPAALLIPATMARVQLKVVPDVADVAVYVNDVLLQMAAGDNVLVNVGVG